VVSDEASSLASAWLRDAARPELDAALRAVFDEASREVDERRPICLAGGHCCRFAEYGHDLFVTGLETAWFLLRAGRPPERRDRSLPILASGACPWLDGRLCGARSARPLGCRTFFCDPRHAAWSTGLLERLHARIRSMHEEFGVVYRYGEWLRMLSLFADAGSTRRGTS